MNKNKGIFEFLYSFKNYIYPILMLIAGLFTGVILFKYGDESFSKAITELFKITEYSFLTALINHFCVYFSVYSISVLLGLCLIGFPIINVIPLLVGIEIAIKLSYFYTTYSLKGIVYSILMIAPEASIFSTILIFTLVKSNSLSKNIFDIISKKEGTKDEINLKSYLKTFLLYAAIISIISLINTACSYFLSTIISI